MAGIEPESDADPQLTKRDKYTWFDNDITIVSSNDDLADLESQIDALAAEIVAEWESESRGDDMGRGGGGRGGNPNHATDGKFASSGGTHHAAKASKVERAQGHADKAAGHLATIAGKRKAAETAHATATAKAEASMKTAKAAKALAKKDPSAKNITAWQSSTKAAIRDRAAAEKHGASAQRHADLHDKAETTHAIAQAKLHEANRAAAGTTPLPASRELHGVGFDRVHGGESVPDVAPASTPLQHSRSHVSEAEAGAAADHKAWQVEHESAVAQHAHAEALKAAEVKPRGTTSTYQPTSVAQEVAQREERMKQSGTRSDPRKSGESWYDYDVRRGREAQDRASKMHTAAAADRDRFVVPPGSVPFPSGPPSPLPRAIALPHAAHTVGLPELPTKPKKKRK